MSNLRRYPCHGRPVFLTIVCYQRHPLLEAPSAKRLVLEILKEIRRLYPFRMHGWVVLHDHMHLLLTPEGEYIPRLVQSLKLRYTRRQPLSRQCWQRRFWDHICRDVEDFQRHLDYIHFNPVKHGLALSPEDYPCSSFHHYAARGAYPDGWGSEAPSSIANMEPE